MDWINIIGAVFTLGMGCLGLFLPKRAAQLTGLEAQTQEGFSEFRGTLGGALIFVSAFALLTLHPVALLGMGLWWAGTAAGRVVSIAVDQASTTKNWAAAAGEAIAGAALIVGAPLAAMIDLLR